MSSFSGAKVGILAALALASISATELRAQPAVPQAPPAQPVPQTMSLAECLAIGLERRPAIKAARHSFNAAVIGQRSLDNIPAIGSFVRPDLPVRKQQSLQGITLAQAVIEKSQQEAIYDITRLYYTYVYARQQEATAADVIEQMELYYSVAEQILKAEVRDPKIKINKFTLFNLQNLIGEIRGLKLEAETGRKQSLEALKEAMGGDSGLDFVPRDTELPIMGGTVTKEKVVELAMTRRPELAMAASGSEAFRLEICAQMKARGMKSETLAAGSDIHSQQVPLPLRNGDYKPGAISPEMPGAIVGKKEDRVARAVELSLRADAVTEQVVNLVRLEAANAYLGWESATKRVAEAKKKYDNSRLMLEEAKTAAITRQDPELIVSNETIAGKALADYVKAAFEHLKALATLERATAGGIRPDFPGR